VTLRDAWHAWLGPAADTITDDQLGRLDEVAATINARWANPDDTDTRDQVLSGAAQVILGDDTLESLAAEWHAARQRERDHMAALTGALLASHTGDRSGPGSEADLIERSGVARMTVRKALGK
jgi:hypothetical protein